MLALITMILILILDTVILRTEIFLTVSGMMIGRRQIGLQSADNYKLLYHSLSLSLSATATLACLA